MIIDDAPRDIKIDREVKDKYESLSNKLKVDKKDIFLLSMKYGHFKDLSKKLNKNPNHLFQFSTLKDEEIKHMVLIHYSSEKDISTLFDGGKIAKTCEEYANGGVRYLYDLFNNPKHNIQIIEDIVEEINKTIK